MRIAAVVNVFPQLTEAFVRLQLLELRRRGLNVSLFSLSRGKGDPSPLRPQYVGHRWSEIPRRLSSEFEDRHAIAGLVRALKQRHLGTFARDAAALFIPPLLPTSLGGPDYDLVHCHFGHVGKEVAAASQNRAAPLVVSFYGFDAYRLPITWGGDMFRSLFRKTSAVISLGPSMDEQLLALGCPLSILRRVPLGVDTDFFSFSPLRKNSDGTIRLLSIARLVEKKGLSVGIQGAAELSRRTGRPVEYRIAGAGPLRRRLEREAAAANTKVTFLGAIPSEELKQELAACDVCVIPSLTASHGDREGTPVAALEAMASGRPVVATNNGDLELLLGNGERGILVEEGDYLELARGIEASLSQEKFSRLLAARAYVERVHSPAVIGETLSALYKSTLS